ncbi:MAG: hypothetical protein JSR77_11790 [Planctomycetes bacterium]|nr:hypothetical protein [Planctomycetota bacterium]
MHTACFVMTCVAMTAAALGQPCDRPAQPTGVTLQQLNNGCDVRLSWLPAARATSYEVYRGRWGTGESFLVQTTQTHFDDTMVYGELTYGYRVVARNACGFSMPSETAVGAPNPGRVLLSSLWYPSMNSDCTRVRLYWRPPTQGTAIGQTLWRGLTTRLEDAVRVADLGPGVNSYDDPGATRGVANWYWLSATNGVCEPTFGWFPIITPPAAVSPPQGIEATDGSYCNAVLVTWGYSTCAQRYRLLRGTTPDVAQALPVTQDPIWWDTSYVDHEAPDHTTLYYWVIAEGTLPASTPTGPAVARVGHAAPIVSIDPELHALPYTDSCFFAQASGADEIQFRWYRDGEPLTDGGRLSGTDTATLCIAQTAPQDEGEYSVVATTACGSATAGPSRLYVDLYNCPPCLPDYNQDGGVDGADVGAFFTDWEASLPCADANRDGGIDGGDAEAFFVCWESCDC